MVFRRGRGVPRRRVPEWSGRWRGAKWTGRPLRASRANCLVPLRVICLRSRPRLAVGRTGPRPAYALWRRDFWMPFSSTFISATRRQFHHRRNCCPAAGRSSSFRKCNGKVFRDSPRRCTWKCGHSRVGANSSVTSPTSQTLTWPLRGGIRRRAHSRAGLLISGTPPASAWNSCLRKSESTCRRSRGTWLVSVGPASRR